MSPALADGYLTAGTSREALPKMFLILTGSVLTSYYIFSFKVSHLASSLKTSRGEDVGHPRTPALALASSHHVLRLGL